MSAEQHQQNDEHMSPEDRAKLQAATEKLLSRSDNGEDVPVLLWLRTIAQTQAAMLGENFATKEDHDELTKRVDTISNPRLVAVEQEMKEVTKALADMKAEKVKEDALRAQAAVFAAKAEEAAKERKQDYKWVVGILGTTVITLIGAIVWLLVDFKQHVADTPRSSVAAPAKP